MQNKPKFYITTPIYYPSDNLHIGHSYCSTAADTIARYKKLTGYDVFFLTGTDEHGQKIERKAKDAGVTPQQYVDKIVAGIKELWKMMDIDYDDFIRTTDERHVKSVQKIFRQLYDQGDIYKSEYEGWYCTPCESFWTELQLKDGCCPDCGRPVEKTREESYFFRLSKYQDWLIDYIKANPEFIQPSSRTAEMLNNFLRPGLQDLCVSRTSFKWGIPVDFDPDHVIYVWIDALSNYITGLGYDCDGNHDELYKKYWPADLHLIGKDIIRFHTIYWPIMLMALNEPLPKQVFGHPWLLTGDSKMSKSKGNVIYADDLVNLFGQDAVRYIMLHEMPYAQDGHVTYELMVERINSDLANNLGNLVNRTVSMSNKYFDGAVTNPGAAEEIDEQLKEKALKTVADVEEKMQELRVADSIDDIMDLVSRCNKYIDENAPWALAKDPEKKDRLATVLYNLLEGIRFAAVLLRAYLPVTAEKIFDQIGTQKRDYDSVSEFGLLETDTHVTAKPEILFQRLNEKEVAEKVEKIQEAQKKAAAAAKKAEKPAVKQITLDDFAKVDLKVGVVLKAEKHPDADSLLIMQVDLGDGDVRQIVSGISRSYTCGQMIGKHIVVISNLKPAVIRGVESQGMLLAGKNDDLVGVVELNGLKPGTKIS